jgi:protein TonB
MKSDFFIPVLLALGVHVVVFNTVSFEESHDADVMMDQGKSTIQLNMLPSVPEQLPKEKIPKTVDKINKVEKHVLPKEVKKVPVKGVEVIKKPVEAVKKVVQKKIKPKPVPKVKPNPKPKAKATESRVADRKKKGVTSPASSESKIKPIYPNVSSRRGEEGTSVYLVEILKNGKAGKIQLVISSGFRRLDKSALTALQSAQYRPSLENGQTTTSKKMFRIKFKIDEIQ